MASLDLEVYFDYCDTKKDNERVVCCFVHAVVAVNKGYKVETHVDSYDGEYGPHHCDLCRDEYFQRTKRETKKRKAK